MPDKENLKTRANHWDIHSVLVAQFQEFYCLYTWTFVFVYFKTYQRWYFSILFNKKIKVIQERKPISSTFKAFKLDSWNSRVNSRCILTLKWKYYSKLDVITQFVEIY